jgi:hypothetical protein
MRLQIFAGLLLAIIGLQSQLHATTPDESVTLNSLIAEVPPGWRRVESTSERAVFERATNGQRMTFSLSAQPIAPLPEDKAFLRFAEEHQSGQLSKLEMVSIHYNSTRKGGAPCLAYDGIYRDKTDKIAPFLTFRGQLCRHPDFPGRIVQVELDQRSSTKDAAYKVDLLELSEQVFSAVQFTELPEAGQSRR